MQRSGPPDKEELAKMQFLSRMVYHHDGEIGPIKEWSYDVFVDDQGGNDLWCAHISEYRWFEESIALAEVDRHISLGHAAYVKRSPDYTDSEIAADKRKARIDYDKDEIAHKSTLSAAWYELPANVHNISPIEHAHRVIV